MKLKMSTKQLISQILLSLIGLSWGFATTHSVALDGSQPYSQIQEAVNASAHGDTVLVYPGRYLENVDFDGKNITIASLELSTGNAVYRDSTIIDGNRSGSVIKSVSTTSSAGIYGFTLTNGTGTLSTYYQGVQMRLGGGITVENASSFYVSNSIIEHNSADWGGGIWAFRSTTHLKDTVVRDNFATIGGGIYMSLNGQVIFNQVNLCSVYNNTAGSTQDVLAADSLVETNIYLDLATICPTNSYYISALKSVPSEPGGFPVIDILRGIRSEINQDIYVSPLGNDDNDGLSPSTALKSIHKALQTVASDSLNPNTVHLSRGVYSTNDGQFFPIGAKPYVKILGDARQWPILENLAFRETITGSRSHYATVENITIDYGDNARGAQAIWIGVSDHAKLKNINILPHQSNTWKGIGLGSNTSNPVSVYVENVHISGQSSRFNSGLLLTGLEAEVRNLTIDNCHATGDEFDSPNSLFHYRGNKLSLENSQILNSSLLNFDTAVVSIGMSNRDSRSRLIMNNVLVANNHSGSESPIFIAAFIDSTSLISNSTFAKNRGGYFATTINGNIQVSNCIFENDSTAEILSMNTQLSPNSSIAFNNNFIRGYPQSFSTIGAAQVSFNDIVLTGNAGFCSAIADDPLAYRLGDGSICRDMGTPDTTGLFLPELDLYGNQRIFGPIIDIGCNEWSYPVSLEDALIPVGMPVSAFPNPFVDCVNIGYSLDKDATVKLHIYNLKGQLLRTLVNGKQSKGEQLAMWEGLDEKGRQVASGIYFLRLEMNDRLQSICKLIKMK
ncbi:MAG: DUF1565 domain-containing protein [Candidatus Cloacimonetes bacterium]|nr:DUF1565 domain-containing protein [Candidatus Cloacimonadota bacterium]